MRSGPVRFAAFAALLTLCVAPAAAQERARAQEQGEERASGELALPMLDEEWDELLAAEAELSGGEATEPLAGPLSYRVQTDELLRLGLLPRFRSLSLLLRDETATAPSLAELNRRLRVDADVVRRLLRAEGYYDALVSPELTGGEAGVPARRIASFDIDTGPLYRFADVQAPGLGVEPGSAVDAVRVEEAVAALRAELLAEGYPFALVPEPSIVIDHETRTASLDLDVVRGPRGRFGEVRVTGERAPFGSRHVARLARFERGERYDAEAVEDLRRALIATGLVGSVEVQPVAGDDLGGGEAKVDLLVSLAPAPPRTLAAQLSYDTEDGIRAEASWQHRNLFPPEGALTATLLAGSQELLAAADFRRSNYLARDRAVGGRLAFSREDRDAFFSRGVEASAFIERETNLIWQKRWTYRLGTEAIFTQERDRSAATPARRDYFIGALPASLAYDGTDDLLDPTENFRVAAFFSPELSLRNEVFGYARATLGASAYLPLTSSRNAVVAVRGLAGSIAGAGRRNIAPSRRFYSGGGGSIRGFGYQDVGPEDADGDPLGGRSKVEMSVEGRYRFGDFGAALFTDAGQVYTEEVPQFGDLRYGVGGGVRYYTAFGPIRADVATPLARRPGEPEIAVYVSIGQAF